jgi:tRNA modification GTPase
MSAEDADTISAVSTPPGEGGISIVRLSGPLARPILTTIFHRRPGKGALRPRRLYLGTIVDRRSGETIDEVLAVYLKGPTTYTREDMAEIHCHGGFAVQQAILRLTLREGARLAAPGEFTRRAFLNGRIDLLQAEAVLDIIEGETEEELRHAADYYSGRVSRELGELAASLRRLLAETEADLDFPEEDLDISSASRLTTIQGVAGEIDRLIDSYYEGRGVREGFEVLITGRTNVGKSSLLNGLLLKERAIVTPLPGTTRDLIEDGIHIKGTKVRLVDTAGLRKPGDVVEEEGIARVKRRIPDADLILWVLDASEPFTEEDRYVYDAIARRPVIAVLNKMDLPRGIEGRPAPLAGLTVVETSATGSEGLEELKAAVHEALAGRNQGRGGLLITHARHRDALERTRDALMRALACLQRNEPPEFLALELRHALYALGDITGETCADEILDHIFSHFCIGK